jgi:hypothetical protein
MSCICISSFITANLPFVLNFFRPTLIEYCASATPKAHSSLSSMGIGLALLRSFSEKKHHAFPNCRLLILGLALGCHHQPVVGVIGGLALCFAPGSAHSWGVIIIIFIFVCVFVMLDIVGQVKVDAVIIIINVAIGVVIRVIVCEMGLFVINDNWWELLYSLVCRWKVGHCYDTIVIAIIIFFNFVIVGIDNVRFRGSVHSCIIGSQRVKVSIVCCVIFSTAMWFYFLFDRRYWGVSHLM